MKTLLQRRLSRQTAASLALCVSGAFATTPGPTQIIQCPGSDEIRQAPSIGSGNTFGAIFWTDGFMVAPMLPRFPTISRCTDDGPFFWVADAKLVGQLPPWGGDSSTPAAWKAAPTVRDLNAGELLQAIAQGSGDTPDKLSYLRRRAWWLTNQAYRSRDEPGKPSTKSDFAEGSAARANLEALVASFDESDANQLLLKAEGLRELARFEEAGQLLKNEKLNDPRMKAFVDTVRQRTALRDARVARVKTER